MLERVLHLLLALEALRSLRRRGRRLARHLVELLLKLASLIRDLFERVLRMGLLLVDVVVELGERGETQLEGRAQRHPAAGGVVVVEGEAEGRGFPGKQPERGRIPARGESGLARLALEPCQRDPGPRRGRVLAHLQLECGQPEVVLPDHVERNLLSRGQVEVGQGHAHRDHRRRIGERSDAIAQSRLAGAGARIEPPFAFALDRHLANPAARAERAEARRRAAGERDLERGEIAVERDLDPGVRAAQRREVATGRGAALERKPGVGRRAVFDVEADRRRLPRERDRVLRAGGPQHRHPVVILAGDRRQVEAPDPRTFRSPLERRHRRRTVIAGDARPGRRADHAGANGEGCAG